jgi:hypothetical protein
MMVSSDQANVPTTPGRSVSMLEKLGLRNRVDLTRYAIKRGLVEP